MTAEPNDHDRLIRIETLVQGLAGVVQDHTAALEKHIREEESELRLIREHMTKADAVGVEVAVLKKEVKELQSMKNKALGWVAAIILAGGIAWELIIHPIKIAKGG